MIEEDNKITIVTGFFPLNREKWDGFNRDNSKYLKDFEFWCRIKNDMIIYTDKDTKEEIEKIRIEKYGRKNTTIICIDDYKKIDEELYYSIKTSTENLLNIKFHLYDTNPESWNANYNYIMLMKEWCVQDAINRKLAKGMIAWIDFGFNHGGEYYINSEEFDFEWKYPFSNKVHFFNIHEIDNIPIFETIRLMSTYIQGCVIVAPDDMWNYLWKFVRENMILLNKIGLSDDDQVLLYMFYKENPEKCELHKCMWFDQFKMFSDQEFTCKRKNENEGAFKNLKSKIKWHITILKYLKRWYKILINEETKC